MKIQHIRRDADDLGNLVNHVVFGRVAMVVLDRVQVGRTTGRPSSRFKRAASSRCVIPAFFRASVRAWPNVFIPVLPATSSYKHAGIAERHTLAMSQLLKYRMNSETSRIARPGSRSLRSSPPSRYRATRSAYAAMPRASASAPPTSRSSVVRPAVFAPAADLVPSQPAALSGAKIADTLAQRFACFDGSTRHSSPMKAACSKISVGLQNNSISP